MRELVETVENRAVGEWQASFIFFNRTFAHTDVYNAQKISLKSQSRRFVTCGSPIQHPRLCAEDKVMLRKSVAWLIAILILLTRHSCRLKVISDRRGETVESGVNHLFAVLHAHQLASLMIAPQGMGVMVSRSKDGDMVIPALRLAGFHAVRGSSGQGKENRGGMTALHKLAEFVGQGHSACLTVDGPRGPRGKVAKGIAHLARQTQANVIAIAIVPRWRIVVTGAWDRLQIPLPFSRIDVCMSSPMRIGDDESLEAFRRRIEQMLFETERQIDPAENIHNDSWRRTFRACGKLDERDRVPDAKLPVAKAG